MPNLDLATADGPAQVFTQHCCKNGRFWTGDRILIRRLHGMNALDGVKIKEPYWNGHQ